MQCTSHYEPHLTATYIVGLQWLCYMTNDVALIEITIPEDQYQSLSRWAGAHVDVFAEL